jgi:hypothetical protein
MATAYDEPIVATITPIEEDVADLSEDELASLAEQKETERRQREELLESLALSISSKFTSRASKRAAKENQWLRSAGLYYGKLAIPTFYSKETPFETSTGENRPDVNVVRSKCSIAIAQTVSMQFGTSNKNWDIEPPKNNTDPEVALACSKMSDEIESQLEEAKYSLNCRRAMWDRVVLGTGILKGPNSAGKLQRAYEKLPGTETWVPTVSVDYAPVIIRVNPWFFYPDETVDEVGKLNDTIETHPMTALELKKYMKHEGFKSDAIARVLERKPEEYVSNSWADFAKLSENNPNLYKDKYMVLEYHGPITRTQLDKLDIDPCYDSINDEYYGEVWVCQGEVIRLELESIEASFAVPYYMSVWEKDPGSVFGFGVPLMMEDAQRVVNETWHMILDNSAMSSGPQVAMQKHLIEPANNKWEMGPKQIWYLTDIMATVDQAIQFFNVPNVTAQIVPIMQMAQGFAEEESGIPLIAAGLQSPEVGETATGQLAAHHASTTLLDFMSEEWDDNMTAPIITSMYAWNMQNNPKPEIKGAYVVDVRTSTEYKNKQLHVRDLEKLSVESAQNQELAKWINQPALQRSRLEMMNLPSKAIIKTSEEVQKDDEARANQGPPPEIMELQLKAREIAVKEGELAHKVKSEQQQQLWDHEEKMTANQARLIESQARVAVSQNEKEIEILKLMQKDRAEAAKITANQQIQRENNLTSTFNKALEETRKSQENELYARELDIKEKTGSGV